MIFCVCSKINSLKRKLSENDMCARVPRNSILLITRKGTDAPRSGNRSIHIRTCIDRIIKKDLFDIVLRVSQQEEFLCRIREPSDWLQKVGEKFLCE